MVKSIPVYSKRNGKMGPRVGTARLTRDERGRRLICIELDEGVQDLELYLSTVDVRMLIADAPLGDDDVDDANVPIYLN